MSHCMTVLLLGVNCLADQIFACRSHMSSFLAQASISTQGTCWHSNAVGPLGILGVYHHPSGVASRHL